MRRIVRPIQSREFPEERRTILLLLGEKAGMRESVPTKLFPAGRLDAARWVRRDAAAAGVVFA